MLKERKRGSQKPEHVGKKLNKETLNFQYWLKQHSNSAFLEVLVWVYIQFKATKER